MDSHLLSKAVQYHGPELIRHMQIEQQHVPGSALDYVHKYRQRDLQDFPNPEFQQKMKNFIARKADFLYITLESDLGFTNSLDDEDSYAKMPPLESFMGIEPSICREHFYNKTDAESPALQHGTEPLPLYIFHICGRNWMFSEEKIINFVCSLCQAEVLNVTEEECRFVSLEKRDIVIGVVSSVSDSGLVLMLLCMDNGKGRDIDDFRISAFCPVKELPRQFLHQNPIENFQVKDKVRGVVLSVNPENEKIIVSLLERSLPEDVNIKLGLVNEEEFPVHYRRKLHIRGLTFDELIHSILGFNNAGNIKCLLEVLNQHEESSLMRGLHHIQIPEKEMSESLRKQQSEKWAHKNVAQGISLFKSGNLMEAMQQLNRALQIDSTNVEALVARGALYANNESFIKAIEDFEAALAIDSQHKNAIKYMVETLIAQGRVHEDQGRYEDSEAYYKQALSMDTESVEAREALRYMFYRKNREENEKNMASQFRNPSVDEEQSHPTRDKSPAERSSMSLKNLIEEGKLEPRDFYKRKRYSKEDMNPEREIKQRKQSLDYGTGDQPPEQTFDDGFNWNRPALQDSRPPYRDGKEQYPDGHSPSREFNISMQSSFFHSTGGAPFVLPGLDLDPIDTFKSERIQESAIFSRDFHDDNDYSDLYGRDVGQEKDVYKGDDRMHEREHEIKLERTNKDDFPQYEIKKECVRSPGMEITRDISIKKEVHHERSVDNEVRIKSPKQGRTRSFNSDSDDDQILRRDKKCIPQKESKEKNSWKDSKENIDNQSRRRDSKEKHDKGIKDKKSKNKLKSLSPQDRRREFSRSPRDKKRKSRSPKEHQKRESRSSRDHEGSSWSPNDLKMRSQSPSNRKGKTRSPAYHKGRSKSPNNYKSVTQSPSYSKTKSRSPANRNRSNSPNDDKRSKSPHGHKRRSRSPADRKKKSSEKVERKEEKKEKSKKRLSKERSPGHKNEKDLGSGRKQKDSRKQEKHLTEQVKEKSKDRTNIPRDSSNDSKKKSSKGSKSPKSSGFTNQNWESTSKENHPQKYQKMQEKDSLSESSEKKINPSFSDIQDRTSQSPSVTAHSAVNAVIEKTKQESSLITQIRSRWDSPSDERYYKEITVHSPSKKTSRSERKEGGKLHKDRESRDRSLPYKMDQKKQDSIAEKKNEQSSGKISDSKKQPKAASPKYEKKTFKNRDILKKKNEPFKMDIKEIQEAFKDTNSKTDPPSPFSQLEQKVIKSKETLTKVKTPSPFSQLEDDIFGGESPPFGHQKDKGTEEDTIWDDVLSIDDEKKNLEEVNYASDKMDLEQRIEMHFKQSENRDSVPAKRQDDVDVRYKAVHRKDLSPKNRSPPNRREERGQSPPRRREERGQSPPRRREERGQSPPRRREERGQSPPRRREERGQSPPRRREERGQSREFEGIRVHIRNDKYLSPHSRDTSQNERGDIPVSIFHVASKPQLIRNRSPIEKSLHRANEIKLGSADLRKSDGRPNLQEERPELSTPDEKHEKEKYKRKEKLSKSDSKIHKSDSKSRRRDKHSRSHSRERDSRRKSLGYTDKGRGYSGGGFDRNRDRNTNRGRGFRGGFRGRFNQSFSNPKNEDNQKDKKPSKQWVTSTGIVIRDFKDDEKGSETALKIETNPNPNVKPAKILKRGSFRNIFRSPRSRSDSRSWSRSRSRSRSRGRRHYSGASSSKRRSHSLEQRRKSDSRFERWNRSASSSSESSKSSSTSKLNTSNQMEGDFSSKGNDEGNSLEGRMSNIKSKENKETLVMLESFLQQLKEKKKKTNGPEGKSKKK